MILDVITVALIVIPMAIGMAKGVAYIAVRTLGWIGALAISFFANPFVSGQVEKSPIGEIVYGGLEEKFSGPVNSADSAVEGLPQIIGGGIQAAVRDTADMLVQTIGGLIISVISFLAMVIILRIVMIFIIRATSKKRGDKGVSILTRMNKFAGLLIGGIEGLLFAFLFLAALIPTMNLVSAETAESIADGLRYSYIAGPLYDGNLLLVMASFK